MRENVGVQIRFLLGPAGSGKTFQCLSEVRAALLQSPEGPPLIFLAPKQATFQIERALLADESLPGYTRLQILSFDRLAEYVVSELGGRANEALTEHGRVMVLRALLAREHDQLEIFRSTARLPGFAAQLSGFLRELQQQQIDPQRLAAASASAQNTALADKLHDVALILNHYRNWLVENRLDDAHTLLDRAADVLARKAKSNGGLAMPGVRLWLDGFAEMTPQEMNLLAAFVARCEQATLAFCLEAEPQDERESSWLSLWTVVAQTYRRCASVLAATGARITTEVLPRSQTKSRFLNTPSLAHIEANWSEPKVFAGGRDSSVRVVTCVNAEAEAIFAAREILRFVRDEGARFRECAILLRTLDSYHDALRRVFTRYGIPFFLDRRESVAHHPVAELTRLALRTVTFGWKRDDWFGALKTGLVHDRADMLDALENEALRNGWDGAQWTAPLPDVQTKRQQFEALRVKITPPFAKLGAAIRGEIDGVQLASALRNFWSELDVEEKLQRWSEDAKPVAPTAALVHDTVWTQVNSWLDDVERAFRSQPLSTCEWLPILEAGLASLSVGVIPPALDQVLVGTIDRARNPELRLLLLLGMNETVFPAPPPRPAILNEQEREALANALESKHRIALTMRQRLAHERYFAYIACTRSREKLILTCAASDARGRALNPSPFLTQMERLVPGVFPENKEQRETFNAPDWREAEHASELAAPLLLRAHPALEALREHEAFVDLVARHEQLQNVAATSKLTRDVVARLYQNPLRTSVSSLESFAECPFRFFLSAGLRVQERKEFEVDHRERGSFQHEILREFHLRATAGGKRWRDLSSDVARELVRTIGEEQIAAFGGGLFNADEKRQFTGRVLIQNLENLVGTLADWMRSYQFDPHSVELDFGFDDSRLGGWRIDLGGGRELLLRGRIDRVDLCKQNDGSTLAVVMDYKSSPRKVDATKLHNGLELQLLSYLGLLRQVTPTGDLPKLEPVGVFYIGLRGSYKGVSSREELLQDGDTRRRVSFQHSGRYSEASYPQLDSEKLGEQFATHHATKNSVAGPEFQQLIDGVENHLREFGRRILDGAVEIAPYRKGSETACDYCEFHAVCRFDSWTEPFRKLEPPPKKLKSETKTRAKKAGAA